MLLGVYKGKSSSSKSLGGRVKIGWMRMVWYVGGRKRYVGGLGRGGWVVRAVS